MIPREFRAILVANASDAASMFAFAARESGSGGGGGSRSFGGEPSENESVCWFPGILLVQVSRRESTWENEVETQRIVE